MHTLVVESLQHLTSASNSLFQVSVREVFHKACRFFCVSPDKRYLYDPEDRKEIPVDQNLELGDAELEDETKLCLLPKVLTFLPSDIFASVIMFHIVLSILTNMNIGFTVRNLFNTLENSLEYMLVVHISAGKKYIFNSLW